MELDDTFEWQGRRIACATRGSGPDVVFCHGTPFSSLLWHPFAEALARDFTVHVWDMPGYGRSSKDAAHPVDFGSQASAFAALLDHWGLTAPHVIAHDFGGAVSLRAHLFEKARYASLMLVDVVAIPPSGSPFFRFVAENPDLLAQLPDYIHRALVRAYIANAALHELPPAILDALVDPWTGPEGQPAFYRQIAHYDEKFLRDNESRAPAIDIPVHIVWGEQDAWIPTDLAHRLHTLIPASTLRLIPEANHLIHYDQPVALMHEVRSWLDSQA
ncbi:pimeloyl-ACP methyl ester carboxylesterase [Nocardia transvalensis]|uniref:Pimeloyl-ACP methyl ester carboxylesterase n=1 Tax=Nocardia transvalensis TaxID=37333 RepID=A0A7W9P9H6_9NOCA|nr:alpha/beta hydrolase [Nocardia transvalensis]MBB5911609.1 pimeloyl-ACP methyl ester carboxylesterase [Nocardia transvalensis]